MLALSDQFDFLVDLFHRHIGDSVGDSRRPHPFHRLPCALQLSLSFRFHIKRDPFLSDDSTSKYVERRIGAHSEVLAKFIKSPLDVFVHTDCESGLFHVRFFFANII